MKCRSKVAVPGRAEAVARVEAVGDPHAAAALWKVFAADTSHHGLIVGVLGRFKTREASQMLAALAVYSRDEKAQAAAVAALRRRAAEYGERLVSLMHTPMRVDERQVPVPGGLRRGSSSSRAIRRTTGSSSPGWRHRRRIPWWDASSPASARARSSSPGSSTRTRPRWPGRPSTSRSPWRNR